MRKLLTCLILSFLAGCSNRPVHVAAGYETLFAHVKKMKKEKGWELEGYGGSFYGDDIKQLAAHFIIEPTDNIDYEKARKMLIKGADEFLRSINKSEHLRIYLNHYPFTNRDIEYGLAFYSEKKEFISYVFLAKGNVYYSLNDRAQSKLVTLVKEPYEEALAKVLDAESSALAHIPQLESKLD